MSGASRIMKVIKQANQKMAPATSQVVSLTVKSISPLIFQRDDRLDITEEFCTFNKSFDKHNIKIGDIVTALVLNNGQSYFIQQNNSSVDEIDYNNLSNKPKINNVELAGNKTSDDLLLIDLETFNTYKQETDKLIESLNDALTNFKNEFDSDWIITDNMTSDFAVYSDDESNMPHFKKYGKLVDVRGSVTPTREFTEDVSYTIFNLPEGYRPKENINKLCQGSYKNKWLLSINADGNVNMSRYGVDTWVNPTSGNWLPFQITFLID